ncbi:NIL domain-containing protein [Candidatus Gracilibacteria bacterium]|nr:NIL domain-containing protein [Candidatus Gracilibacteria bacterium]
MAETISREFRLEFPKNLVKEPVISNVIKKFDLTANIRRADVTADGGWLILSIEGAPEVLDDAEKYISECGVKISPAESDLN